MMISFLAATMCNTCNEAFGISGDGIPLRIFNITSLIYTVIKIAVPLILIIVGMIDMAKAVTSKDESEIKKAQNLLIRKGITAALVFLVFSLVSLLFNIVSSEDDDHNDISSCVSSLLNGCNCHFVYKCTWECPARGSEPAAIHEGYYDDESSCEFLNPYYCTIINFDLNDKKCK